MTIDRRYSVAEGTAIKAPCRVATTANISLTGLQSIDGVTVAEHDRVLVKDQTVPSANGIYGASTGNWSRTKDFDGAYDIVCGTKIYVTSGSVSENTEYTVTSADPITIGTSSIVFEAIFDSLMQEGIDAANAATAAAAVVAALAAGYAAALGNQAYTFDYYAQAEVATVPVGVKSLRLMGYVAAGDGPQSTYYRVASQPSTINRIRTTDRFLPNGSTSAGNGGWWQMVLDDVTDVRKYGIFGDGSTDVTTVTKNALTAGSILFPPSSSNYIMSGDINTFVSNRRFWVQTGATIINTGGRLTAAVAGITNVHIKIDGVCGFLATTTAVGKLDWPDTVPGGTHRGLIEMGGTHASPGTHLSVTGKGRVYSDYVWAGVPTGLTNLTLQLNRKGIAFINAAHCLAEGLEVDHIHGEAVYTNGYENSEDIKFLRMYVHDVAFDALNFNMSLGSQGHEIGHCRVYNAYAGIEMSSGSAHDNYLENCYYGIVFGGGAGIGPIYVINNTAAASTEIAFSLQFGTITQNVVIIGNSAVTSGKQGFALDKLQGFQFKDNSAYNWASISASEAIVIVANCSRGHIHGNLMSSAGVHSTGTLVNNAGAANTIGTNPTY